MLCPPRHQILNLASTPQRVVNRIVDRAWGKKSKPQDLEPPFLPLVRNEPNIFAPRCDLTRAEIAYGHWALPQLMKDLHSPDVKKVLMALNSLSDMFHDPEKIYEAVRLKIVHRIHELLKCSEAVIKEAALLALGVACNHFVGSDSVLTSEARCKWAPENLFDCTRDEDSSSTDDDEDNPAIYFVPVDFGKLAIVLSDPTPSVRHKAAHVVNNISKTWDGPESLCKNNFVPILLERVKFEEYYVIKTEVLEALLGCLLKEQYEALELGGMSLLSALLQSEESRVRSASAACIAALSMHPKGKVIAIELDLLASLKPLLFVEERDELANVAGCISFITMTTPSKIRAVELEIIDRLVFLASDHICLKLQLNSVKALTNISEAPKGRMTLLNEWVDKIENIPCNGEEALERAVHTLLKVIRWRP